MKTKKVIKKKKDPTQKQTQSQKTKVVVNIGKTTRTRKARTPKKAPEPIQARPQIIPVYTPIYQSQQPQQQQNPPYNLDDIKSLFKARENTRENLQQEILKDVVEQTQGPTPQQIREEARQRQQAEIQGRREGEIVARGEEILAERQIRTVEAEALRQANIRRQQEEAEQQRQREVQQRRDEARQRREQRREESFSEPENYGEELRVAFFRDNTNPDLQQVLIDESLEPVVNRPPATIITDQDALLNLRSEDAQLYQRLYGATQAPETLERIRELEQEREQIEETFYKPQATTFSDLLQPPPATIDNEFFEVEEPEEEAPAGGGGGGGGGWTPSEGAEEPPEEEPKKLIGGGPAEEPPITPKSEAQLRAEQRQRSIDLKKQYNITNDDELSQMIKLYNRKQSKKEDKVALTQSISGNRNNKNLETLINELLVRGISIPELKKDYLDSKSTKKDEFDV
jgi:hypothetical protein